MRTFLLTACSVLFIVLSPNFADACSCIGNGSACSALSGTPVVFVGRVTKDSGEGVGAGLGRMTVEEVLHGLPKDIGEVDVDTAAGTSCYMRLEEGTRVVLYGSVDPKNPKLIHYRACSYSFRVEGNEALLDALRATESGAPPRLVGNITKRIEKYYSADRANAGIRVIAANGEQRLETTTTGDGQFEFRVISPGDWKLSIEQRGYLQDNEYDSKKGAVTVPENRCETRHLSIVADGHISGRVTNKEGMPIAGVPVQVFNFESRRNEFETLKFAEATTKEDGSYDIGGLPPQEYILGVNAEKYSDKNAYPPTYWGSNKRDNAQRIALKESERKSGVDLVLPDPRAKATLILELRYEDGSFVTATGIPRNNEDRGPVISSIVATVDDLTGIQRAFANQEGPVLDGRVRLSLWTNETYVVKASRSESELVDAPQGGVRIKFKTWKATSGPIRITDAETTLRLVLVRQPEP